MRRTACRSKCLDTAILTDDIACPQDTPVETALNADRFINSHDLAIIALGSVSMSARPLSS